MRLETEVIPGLEEDTDLTLRIVQIAECPYFGRTRILAGGGGLTPCQTGVGTERTLVHRHRTIVHIAGIVGAGVHAVAAEDTLVAVDPNRMVLVVIGRMGGAHFLTGSVLAVLTLAGHEDARDDVQVGPLSGGGIGAHPDAMFIRTKEDTVLLFTGDFTRLTVDTVFVV